MSRGNACLAQTFKVSLCKNVEKSSEEGRIERGITQEMAVTLRGSRGHDGASTRILSVETSAWWNKVGCQKKNKRVKNISNFWAKQFKA